LTASEAQFKAVVADGLYAVLVSPYIPPGTNPTQTLFNSDAASTEDVVRIAPSSILFVELMNEPNDVPVNETQLTASQYISYANTIISGLSSISPHVYISSGGATTGASNFVAWQDATVPSIGVDWVGAQYYGVNSSQFEQTLLNDEAMFKSKYLWQMTQWTPSSYNDISTAWSQLYEYIQYFGVYNLNLLEENPSWGFVFPPNSPPALKRLWDSERGRD
jgi:hypothetical protein